MTDPKANITQTCYGQYCTFWKFYEIVTLGGANISKPVMTQGCFNWTSNFPKHLGCYPLLEQPMVNMKNGISCFCNQDFCNSDQTPTNAQMPRVFTCVHSASNGTCQGYACITIFKTRPGQNSTIEQTCQNLYQNVDEMEISEMVQDSQQPLCVTGTSQDAIGVIEEIKCYCFLDFCNQNQPGSTFSNANQLGSILFNANFSCKSEICNSSGCFSIESNSICTGQYCIAGKIFKNFQKFQAKNFWPTF